MTSQARGPIPEIWSTIFPESRSNTKMVLSLAVQGEIQPAQPLGDRDASGDRLGGGVKLVDSTILHVREVEHLSVKQEGRLL